MALRFVSEDKSWSEGIVWKAEIHDKAFVGDPTAFIFGGDGIEFQWRQDGGDVYAPILGSSAAFEMVVQNETHEDLITDLAGAAEGRFTIVIYKDEVFFWAGVVNAPELSIQDFDFPYGFKIEAVDGLALLKNYPYSQGNRRFDDAYEAQSTLVGIIARCLKKLPHVVTHFTDTDPFIVTAVNWYSDFSGGFDVVNDPFWEHYVDNRAFVTGQVSGNGKFMSCYEVVGHILRRFHAQIGLFDGYFKVEQFEYRAATMDVSGNYARSYDYALTAPVEFELSEAQPVGGAEDVKRLRGGTYSYLSPLKAARAEQTVNGLKNLIPAFITSSGAVSTGYAVGSVKGNGLSSYVRFTAMIEWELENVDLPINGTVFGLFRLRIELDGKTAQREVDYSFGGKYKYSAIKWQSDLGGLIDIVAKFEVAAATKTWTGQTEIDLLFRTASDFLSGDLVVSFDFEEATVSTAIATATIDPADYNLEWVLKDPYLVIQKSRTAFAPKNATYEVGGEAGNTELYETKSAIGDLTGDVLNQWGGILYFEDPHYVYTTEWGLRTAAQDRTIAQLTAQRIVSHRYRPRKTFRGAVVGNALEAQNPIEIDGVPFWFAGGKYSTVRDELQGEWVQQTFSLAEFEYEDPEYDTGSYEPSTPGSGGTGGGGNVDNGGAGSPPGVQDGNGIYSGSGIVPDETEATIDEFYITGADGSSIAITTGSSLGGRVNSNFSGASLVYKDTGGYNIISVQSGGASITLNGSVGAHFLSNNLIKYGADYSADYDNRTLVDKEYVDNNSGTGDINNGGNTTGAAITIGTNDNFALNFETNNVTRQSIATDGAHTLTANHTTTTTTKNVLTLQVNNDSGVGATGYGGAILFQGESSTTTNRDMAYIRAVWQTATDATRRSNLAFGTVQSGVFSEAFRINANTIQNAPGSILVIGGTSDTVAVGNSSGLVSINSSAISASAVFLAATGNSTSASGTIGNTSFSTTSGTKYEWRMVSGFAPTSGTGSFYNLRLAPTVNQTGGANGKTGAIIFEPVLTSIGSKWSALTSPTSNSNALFINQTGANSYSTHVGAFGFGATTVPTDKVEVTGNIALLTAGNKIKIATGSNASLGTATLVGGTVTVNTTAVTASSKIFLSCNTPGGTQGFLSAADANVVAGTSFVINSSSATDTSTVNWWIVN